LNANDGLTILAPAKINLFLKVLGKRSDGYHDVFSLVQAVNLYDTLVIENSHQTFELIVDNPRIPADQSNLVWKATELLRREAGFREGVRISLEKKIPMGAGLGGGSSDAAAALKGINSFLGLGLSNSELMELGARIGSDVPFFFSTGTALVSGRGETVDNVTATLDYGIILVVPDFEIQTAKAYQELRFFLTTYSDRPTFNLALNGLDFFDTLNRIGNDFQAMVEDQHPLVSSCLRTIREMGAKYVSLSGSGSSFFGLFRLEDLPPNDSTTPLSKQHLGWQVCSLVPVAIP
jgi:4-diphosphocytidyl-2-C-methyl-D-erythritol kinase